MFDSVIVVTDRVVLDQQLQNTIYQFEHKQGVVQKIDLDSAQLADALASGVPSSSRRSRSSHLWPRRQANSRRASTR